VDCREILETALARTAGEPADDRQVDVERHLEGCASCRQAAAALDDTWERIALPEPDVSVAFRERTIGRMQEALARRNVVPFRPRPWWKPVLQAAALLVTGVGGFLLARASAPPPEFPVAEAERAGTPAVAVVSERQLDASRVGLDLSGNPRLLNVAFRPSDGDGRLSISFDVTTRYHVSGRRRGPGRRLPPRLRRERRCGDRGGARAGRSTSSPGSSASAPPPRPRSWTSSSAR
jgi:hypothetical protein